MPLIVYTATNRTNGKIYVGITMQPLAARMAQHKSRAGRGNRAFPNAIAKYGMDGFEWAIVQTCETPAELHAAEVAWIAKLNSLADGGHGYNRTFGGGGTAGFRQSDETKAKQSTLGKARNWVKFPKNRQLPMFKGRINYRHSDEVKTKIGEAGKGCRRNLKIQDEWVPHIVSMHRQGKTQNEIGLSYGVNRATISYVLKRAGARP